MVAGFDWSSLSIFIFYYYVPRLSLLGSLVGIDRVNDLKYLNFMVK